MHPRWCLAIGVFVVAPSARAASIDIRCPKLDESSKSELEARAQLLLTSAKMQSASIGIACAAGKMWVLWIDGRSLQIDTSSGIVEGSLDAIEDLIVMSAHPHRDKSSAQPSLDPHLDGNDGKASNGNDGKAPNPPPREVQEKTNPSSLSAMKQQALEGGVVVSTLAEVWDGSLGVGPRFEVGLRIGGPLAFVLTEGARFGVGSSSRTLAFDLQWGLAYGAPYARRTGLGLVLLGGAERVAATTAVGGWFAWRATGSVGLRASSAVGSVDLWMGPELIVRSGRTETLTSTDSTVPQLSGMLSVGCLFPAFGVQRDAAPAIYAVEQ
jgi:hypothetical protein